MTRRRWTMAPGELVIHERTLHPNQTAFVESAAKRIVIRAGRRGGKTVGVACRAVRRFLGDENGAGRRRQLYAAPTQEQVDAFWYECKRALDEPIRAGVIRKNESLHLLEVPGTRARIRAKTAWNADTLRGDYADDLYLDEWQLMDESAWGLVGAPMLMDNDGDAVFIYTPLTLRTRSVSKARDPQHAAKMFKAAQADTSGRWATFHFASHENPFISQQALEDISRDLSSMAYRQEILAEDVDEPPGALWKRDIIDAGRVEKAPALVRVVVAVDPAATGRADSDETGIVVAGVDAEGRGYVLKDASMRGSPSAWAAAVAREYEAWQADRVVAEVNNGGDMVEQTVRGVEEGISYRAVRASRGKDVRAEPVSARYERGLVHHVGAFNELEDQMCGWVPGQRSPDRMDALVWALTDLMLGTENPDNYVFAVA